MAMRELMALADMEEARNRPYLNSGGPLDIFNGKYIPKVGGGYALSGGMGLTMSVIGKANTFKSTLMNGAAINTCARFPESTFVLYDTEYSVSDKNRLAGMSSLHLDDPDKRALHLTDLKRRIKITDPTEDAAESLDAWFDFMKVIRDDKVKNYKDFEVETEVIDLETGKPYRMLIPTFVNIDSWSEAAVRQLNVKNEEFNADTEMKDQRTINMEEGWQKKRLMRQLPKICAQGGIYTYISGHLGKKISMDGKPNSKDLTYMGQDEAAKAMGNNFYFLMSAIIKISNARVLVDKNDRRLTDYPSDEHVSGAELQELDLTLIRSKNSPTGFQTQLVSSQRFGIMNGLSYYNSLRNNKYYGLGTPNKVKNPILGDLNLGRTKIFDLSLNYKVERALELTYQLFFIQNNWSFRDQPVDYSIPIEVFAEKLQGSGYAIDDILNSRGWWTYKSAPGIDRSYLTLPDILEIINGNYKPKLIAVSSPRTKESSAKTPVIVV